MLGKGLNGKIEEKLNLSPSPVDDEEREPLPRAAIYVELESRFLPRPACFCRDIL
jgi:hypothetical protein